MPWRLDSNAEGCAGVAVVKKDTGDVVKCHDTRDQALDHLRALYANEATTAAAVEALAAELLSEGIAAAAVDFTDGSMIALYPAPAQAAALARENGQPAETLHVTLAFLPESVPLPLVSALTAELEQIAAAREGLAGTVGGIGEFSAGDDGSPALALPDVVGLSEVRVAVTQALERVGVVYATEHGFLPHITLGYHDGPAAHDSDVIGLPLTFSALSLVIGPERIDYHFASPVVASAAPLRPPAEWFEDPRLDGPTPLTVTADGRVFGHLAEWGKCHTAIGGRCVIAPRSSSSYGYFHTGTLELDNGEQIRVGKITAGTGHASLSATGVQAASHYDNTGHVAAFVRAGEDEHGPWLAGVVKSDATPEQVRDLRANPPSGDWRKLGGRGLELIAALAVPVPGFPVAAIAASASGEEEMTALIMGRDDEGDAALVAGAEPANDEVRLNAISRLFHRRAA